MFDGSRGYEDCDITIRFLKAGFDLKMNPCAYTYQRHSSVCNKNAKIFVRCCNLCWDYASKRHNDKIFKANTIPITDEEYANMAGICHYSVTEEDKGRCNRFTIKDSKLHIICPYDGDVNRSEDKRYRDIIKLYRHPSLIFDLEKQRKNINNAIKELKQMCDK